MARKPTRHRMIEIEQEIPVHASKEVANVMRLFGEKGFEFQGYAHSFCGGGFVDLRYEKDNLEEVIVYIHDVERNNPECSIEEFVGNNLVIRKEGLDFDDLQKLVDKFVDEGYTLRKELQND